MTYLVTEYGKPFTAAGFGNKFRDWCNQAGLHHCSAHGIRKSGAKVAAENGATAHQLMAMFGWETIKQAEHYTRRASQRSSRRAPCTCSRAKTKNEQATKVSHFLGAC